MTPEDTAKSPAIEYVQPSSEAIDQYAQQVCRQLGQEYDTAEMRRGLAAFMKVIAQICARHADQLLDKPNKHG